MSHTYRVLLRFFHHTQVAKNPQMMSMFQQDKDFMQIVNVLVMQMNPEMAQRAQRAAQEEERQKEAQKDAAASAVNKGYGSWAPPKKKKEEPEQVVPGWEWYVNLRGDLI